MPTLKPPLANSSSPSQHEPDPSDIAKLRKWQEDRIARKLQGEYESAVLHLSELINNNLSTPLQIASVRVDGAVNTRRSFLSSLIKPHVLESPLTPSSHNFTTLESVLRVTRHISHLLQETDIFQSVEAKIERSRGPFARANDVDVVFKTREKGRLFLNTSTEVGNGDGNATVTARVRNTFGGAELLEANLSLGTKTRRSYRALLSTPITHTLRTRGELSVFGLERDNSSYASSYEGLRGIKAIVRNGSCGSPMGMHEFAYEAVLRHIGGLTPTASISLREVAGQTFKSSISHTWTLDTRDDRLTASKGFYTKVFQEFAGLCGDASFYKVEAEGQLSRRLVPGVIISFAARSGLLWSISRPSLFSDRFQLGGPTGIRSFKANGLGPRDGLDSVGGDLYWSSGFSIISDIPRKPHWPVKTHLFVNAGRLDAMNRRRTLAENITSCISKPSISAGVGLIYRFDPIRVEVNFGLPITASRSDGTRRGIQVGMGLEFL